MGLFDKIKNILFEEDDEVEQMPVYTKENTMEEPETVQENNVSFVEEPIKSTDNSHFNNVKRDIDFSFGDDDVLGEVLNGGTDAFKDENKKEETPVTETVVTVQKEEKKSIFPSFDEAEFERLNSRINRNENKIKREATENPTPQVEARKANNNFSSNGAQTNKNAIDPDRYKIKESTTRKPFTPSPVISPVYGILDKNYRKDEIVDKKNGLKREKIVKSVAEYGEKKEVIDVQKEDLPKEDNSIVDIDSVRKKAYGELENIEKQATIEKNNKKNEPPKEEIKEEIKPSKPEPSIEEQLDDKEFEVTNVIDVNEEPEVIDKKLNNATHTKEEKTKPQAMDEMEKTSTLQILDDIEKELNSIKPMTEEETIKEDEEIKDHLERSDTLENDLFNLIDSMYEGEEEEDD